MSAPGPGASARETGGQVLAPPPRTVGRSLAWLSSATTVQLASGFVLGVVVRAILGPARTGVWNLVEVWRAQLAAFSLGASAAADRDMPELRSQGRLEEESQVRSVAFTFTMGEAAAVAIGFWAYWAINRRTFSSDLALGLALVPIMASLTSYVSIYQLFLKNQKQFHVYAGLLILQAVIDWSALAWVLIGGLRLLFIGMAVGWLTRAAIHYAAVRRRRLFQVRLTLQRAVLFPMLRLGIWISTWSVIRQLMLRLDSLVVGIALGTTSLGLYYLGPQIAAAAAAVPMGLAVIAWPNLMETFGRGGPSALEADLERYVRPVGLVIGPLSGAAALFGASVLVRGFLPAFVPGLAAMKIYILTAIFLHVTTLLRQALVAMKRVRLLVGLACVALFCQGGVLAVGALAGLTRLCAAWSAVTGQGVLVALLFIFSCRALRVRRENILRFWVRVPVGWIALVTLLLAINALSPTPHGVLPALAAAIVELAVFLAAGAPIVLALDRNLVQESISLIRRSG